MVSALEINSNGGLKQEHGESCHSAVATSYLHYYNAFFLALNLLVGPKLNSNVL